MTKAEQIQQAEADVAAIQAAFERYVARPHLSLGTLGNVLTQAREHLEELRAAAPDAVREALEQEYTAAVARFCTEPIGTTAEAIDRARMNRVAEKLLALEEQSR